MFVNSPSGASSYWYDRSPLTLAYGYSASALAPHAATQRWSYTVPSGRSAMIGSASLGVGRVAAPTSANISTAYCSVTPSGLSAVVTMSLSHNTNQDPYAVNGSSDSGAVLSAGDTIAGFTENLSTGGTEWYQNAIIGTEFNA